jgi:hypothetical protein
MNELSIIEAPLQETLKVEVVLKEKTHTTGKVFIDNESQTMTFVGGHFTLTELQNNLFRILSETGGPPFSIPFAGDVIFPGTWTIIFKTDES